MCFKSYVFFITNLNVLHLPVSGPSLVDLVDLNRALDGHTEQAAGARLGLIVGEGEDGFGKHVFSSFLLFSLFRNILKKKKRSLHLNLKN